MEHSKISNPSAPSPATLLLVLETARSAAREAGRIIARLRASPDFAVGDKSDGSQITAGDHAAQKAIISAILNAFPSHQILAEELSQTEQAGVLGAEHLWIVDPIDGTTNYAYGMNRVGVSIAYSHHGLVYAGVVFNPFEDEMFSAVRGSGATRNDQPLTIGSRRVTELSEALVATGFPPLTKGRTSEIARVTAVVSNCRDIRRAGACSLDLCDVAAGRLDGYYETVQSWDMAAGGLIAREAGAELVSFVTEKPLELESVDLLCARPSIRAKLAALLRSATS